MSDENVKKNVFISHHSADDEHIGKIKDLLNKNGYTLRNSSIDSTKPNDANNPEYIKGILRERIAWASTVIVLIGQGTHAREYVEYEIEQAHVQGKRIVGVFVQGESDAEVPDAFEKYGDVLVGWNSDKIIDAIDGKYGKWHKSDGSPWVGSYTPNREIC